MEEKENYLPFFYKSVARQCILRPFFARHSPTRRAPTRRVSPPRLLPRGPHHPTRIRSIRSIRVRKQCRIVAL